MSSEDTGMRLMVVAALSVAAHVGLYVALGSALSRPAELATSEVAIEIIEPEPLPPPPEPEVVPPPEPEPPRPVERVARRDDAPPPPEPETPTPPPEQEQAIAEFDNLTLTAPEGQSWAIAPSSGVSREGPIGPPGARVGERREGSPNGIDEGTGTRALIAAGDLGNSIAAPNLDSALQRNFPPRARQQGIEGEAQMRIVIEPDGTVGRIRVLSESVGGFGFAAACTRTLRGSRWTPPRDRAGNPVATEVEFTCAFDVDL